MRGSRGHVLDHEVVGGDRAQADRVGRVAVARPVPALARPVQQLLVLEVLQDLARFSPPKRSSPTKGSSNAAHFTWLTRICRLSGLIAALLDRRAEEVVGVLRDELVERRRVGDQHRHRGARAPAGAARLLPGRGDGARIAHQHRRVEAADVDPELERVRGDDPEHRALAQPALDLAALERQVAAAVAADDAFGARLRLERLLQVGHEHLGREPRGGEHDRLQPLAEERQRHVARRVERRLADAELAVHDRRVVDREVALAARRAALVDERHLALGQALRQLLRVADRGRGADELRPQP